VESQPLRSAEVIRTASIAIVAADHCAYCRWKFCAAFGRGNDGKTCVEPSNPASDCRKKGWTWTGARCIEPQKKIELQKKIIVVPKKACPPGTKGVFPRCVKG